VGVLNLRKYIFLILASLVLFCSCGHIETDETMTISNGAYPKVIVRAQRIKFDYIEPLSGELHSSEMVIEEMPIEDVVNHWMNHLSEMDVSYGKTGEGDCIFLDLTVYDAYLIDEDIILVMSDSFGNFESNNNESYSNPGDFIFGLKSLLIEISEAKTMTLDYEDKHSDTIHQDGVVITRIPLQE